MLTGTAIAPAHAGPACTCRYAGADYEIGQVICIRGRLARCEMALNNTSWKPLEDFCPQAHRPQMPQPGTQAKPAA